MKGSSLAALACALLVAACAHPLAGRFWHPASGTFVEVDEIWQRAAGARHVLLGEIHDNPDHHRFQREALEALAARGPRRALAMEQFDVEYQAAIDAAPAEAEAIADAGRFDRRGWNWPHYRPLVAFALARGWPLLAANLSRTQALAAVPGPGDPAVVAALERDMIDGHCGHRPGEKALASMVSAQRARDLRMAQVMAAAGAGRTALIAGNGHVRRDRGVPLYLGASDVLVIAQIEALAGKDVPMAYLQGGFATGASYDYVRFTPAHPREDPCAAFRKSRSSLTHNPLN